MSCEEWTYVCEVFIGFYYFGGTRRLKMFGVGGGLMFIVNWLLVSVGYYSIGFINGSKGIVYYFFCYGTGQVLAW